MTYPRRLQASVSMDFTPTYPKAQSARQCWRVSMRECLTQHYLASDRCQALGPGGAERNGAVCGVTPRVNRTARRREGQRRVWSHVKNARGFSEEVTPALTSEACTGVLEGSARDRIPPASLPAGRRNGSETAGPVAQGRVHC